jgi:hypothetical protein
MFELLDLLRVYPFWKSQIVHPGEQQTVPLEIEDQFRHGYRSSRRIPSRQEGEFRALVLM